MYMVIKLVIFNEIIKSMDEIIKSMEGMIKSMDEMLWLIESLKIIDYYPG